jgi:hypothetical protein
VNCQIFRQNAEIDGLDIVEGSAPFKTERDHMRSESQKYTNTGQSRQFCPTNQEKRMMMKKWIDWHFKKGAVEAIGEKSPQKKLSHEKMKPSTALGIRNGGTPVGYLGMNSLKEGAM